MKQGPLVRVGIATDLVVVGDVIGEGGSRQEEAVGQMLDSGGSTSDGGPTWMRAAPRF